MIEVDRFFRIKFINCNYILQTFDNLIIYIEKV